MADRYFVDEPIDGLRALLRGSEAHHLAHVMRAQPGDTVTLFDGSGAEFAARVERVGRAEIELAIISHNAVDRELPVPLTLGVALPKGDRQRWLVEKATELGVSRIVPLVTERSGEHQAAAGHERLRRAVIEASKQCGRNRLLEIRPVEKLNDFLTATPAAWLRWIGHVGGQHVAKAIGQEFRDAHPEGIALAVGPEGGFTDAEVDFAAAQGWQAVGLGARILRVETAAIALVAVVTTRLQFP